MTDAYGIPGLRRVALREGLESYRLRLQTMFEDEGLRALRANQPNHPAVATYDALGRFLQLPRFEFSWYLELLDTIGSALIEEYLTAQPLPSPAWCADIPAGALPEIRAGLRTPAQYPDTTAEIYTRARLRGGGLDVDFVAPPGADLAVAISDLVVPLEVKRAKVGSAVRSVTDALAVANRQIKVRVGTDQAGVVVMLFERGLQTASGEGIPNDVAPYVDAIQRAVNGQQLRSVGHVLLSWDDYILLGEAPEQQLFTLRRHTQHVDHANPRSVVPTGLHQAKLGGTAGMFLSWQPS